ncbi:hypothetical protein B1M_28966 [Burkholderia sp. TJI49]|nr:hypothetical protein B1M_28966 [Burkholderia sp. TJI49]
MGSSPSISPRSSGDFYFSRWFFVSLRDRWFVDADAFRRFVSRSFRRSFSGARRAACNAAADAVSRVGATQRC